MDGRLLFFVFGFTIGLSYLESFVFWIVNLEVFVDIYEIFNFGLSLVILIVWFIVILIRLYGIYYIYWFYIKKFECL